MTNISAVPVRPVSPQAGNAIKHGLAASAVVLPWESEAEWEAYRDGMIDALQPASFQEFALALSIAELSWRLRRVAGAEREIVARMGFVAALESGALDPVIRHAARLGRSFDRALTQLLDVPFRSHK